MGQKKLTRNLEAYSLSEETQTLRVKELKRLLRTKHLTDKQGVKLSLEQYRALRKEMETELDTLLAMRARDLLADMFNVAVSIAADVHPEDITSSERHCFQQVADFLNVNLDKLLPSS